LIRVGYIIGAHGVRGAVRVRLDNPDSALVGGVDRLTLACQGWTHEYHVAGVQAAGQGTFKIILCGINRAEQALALRGAVVMVQADSLPRKNPREFYYFEALGCGVVTTAGVHVGTVEDVFSNGANDVWVVRDESTEHLVPVIEDIVQEMDLAARRIVINPVPGLLD
jgi:16S rRNA processing protein RimM